MKLLSQGANVHVLEIGESKFLFSYETLVACIHNGKGYRAAEEYSVTTSRHVSSFLVEHGYTKASTLGSYEHQRIIMLRGAIDEDMDL